MKNEIQRYNANERSNHWAVAILFFMAGLSGLALFHPALFWLTNLFGGGPWTRILHPFLGLAMFVFFLGLVMINKTMIRSRDMSPHERSAHASSSASRSVRGTLFTT